MFFQGVHYRVILQCRVNPTAIQFVPHSETGLGDYYRIEKEDDMRTYGICIFKEGTYDDDDFITGF